MFVPRMERNPYGKVETCARGYPIEKLGDCCTLTGVGCSLFVVGCWLLVGEFKMGGI